MPKRSSKRQKDHQELARKVLDEVVPDAEDVQDDSSGEGKNPAAVALGRLGGLKGGPARAAKLTKKQRSEIAKKAAAKRWGHDADSKDSPMIQSSSSTGGASG